MKNFINENAKSQNVSCGEIILTGIVTMFLNIIILVSGMAHIPLVIALISHSCIMTSRTITRNKSYWIGLVIDYILVYLVLISTGAYFSNFIEVSLNFNIFTNIYKYILYFVVAISVFSNMHKTLAENFIKTDFSVLDMAKNTGADLLRFGLVIISVSYLREYCAVPFSQYVFSTEKYVYEYFFSLNGNLKILGVAGGILFFYLTFKIPCLFHSTMCELLNMDGVPSLMDRLMDPMRSNSFTTKRIIYGPTGYGKSYNYIAPVLREQDNIVYVTSCFLESELECMRLTKEDVGMTPVNNGKFHTIAIELRAWQRNSEERFAVSMDFLKVALEKFINDSNVTIILSGIGEIVESEDCIKEIEKWKAHVIIEYCCTQSEMENGCKHISYIINSDKWLKTAVNSRT